MAKLNKYIVNVEESCLSAEMHFRSNYTVSGGSSNLNSDWLTTYDAICPVHFHVTRTRLVTFEGIVVCIRKQFVIKR